jgi:hypothetical protein
MTLSPAAELLLLAQDPHYHHHRPGREACSHLVLLSIMNEQVDSITNGTTGDEGGGWKSTSRKRTWRSSKQTTASSHSQTSDAAGTKEAGTFTDLKTGIARCEERIMNCWNTGQHIWRSRQPWSLKAKSNGDAEEDSDEDDLDQGSVHRGTIRRRRRG